MSKFSSTLPTIEVAKFCQRWKIQELALFGSALRDDFRPDSDVDILVTFAADADWGLLNHVKMQRELQTLLRRDVDLITKRAIERSRNWLRRSEILRTAQTEVCYWRGFCDAGDHLHEISDCVPTSS